MVVAIPVGAKADESSFKSVADQVEKVFSELGGKIGKDLSGSLVDGFSSGEKSARQSAEKVVKSYDKVADATGRVRTIQEQYNAALDSGNTTRIVRETERLEAARRKESAAIRQTINDLKDYEDSARKASGAFETGFSSGFSRSRIGGFFSDLKSEAESSGSMAGVLAGRAMGAGITAGLAAATAGVAAVIGGVGYTLTKGFERLKNIDQAESKLKALGHTGSEVKKIMTDAEASVKGTAFSLDAAVGAAASSVAAGVNPGADLTTYLTTIGDTAAVAKVSFDDMASIFNKVQANGRAFTSELQQLSDKGIPIFTYLQKATGLAGDEFTKFVKKGGVDARLFRTVLEQELGGSALKMGESFSGAMDNLGAAIGRLGAAALAAPFDSAAGLIGALTGKLDQMTAWMKANQGAVIDFWSTVANITVTSLDIVNTSISGTMTMIGGLLRAMAGVDKFLNRIPGMGGNEAEAAKLDQWADSVFRIRDGFDQAGVKIDGFKDSIKDWAEQGKMSARFGDALGGTTAEVVDRDVVVGPLPQGPGGPAEKLAGMGFGLEQLGDGRTRIVPRTTDANAMLDAWKRKQGGDSAAMRAGVAGGAPIAIAGGDGGGGKAGKEPPPYFDPSLWSLAAIPVPGTSVGPTDNTSILNARTRVEEARLRLLELEAKGNVAQSTMVSAKNNVLQAERALRDAELKAAEAHQKALQRHTGALESIGAQIDQDFGISKGLPGIAENLTKFLANLALAPALGALQAIAGPVRGVGGGMVMPQGMAAAGIGGFPMGGYGGNVAAMMALAQSASGRTKYGPASDLVNGLADCSGSISDLVEMLQTGKTTPGRLFTTTNFASDEEAAKLGFRPGYMPGALNVGVNPYPGQSGHMAATLPNGVHFEGGGATGGGAQYGGNAAGADDPQFERRYHMPVGPPSSIGYSGGGGYGMAGLPGMALSSTPPAASVIGGDGAMLPGLVPGAGQGLATAAIGPGGVPMPAPIGIAGAGGGSMAPVGLDPSVGAGGEGFQGLSGLPMDALMTAASMSPIPGTGIAAQIAIKEINRAIAFGGQMAGIGVSGLLNTFLPRESPLADVGNSWLGRIASGFAGARPAGNNMAGQSTMPNPDDARGKQQPGQQGQGGNTINNEITLNNNNATEDAQGKDLTHHLSQQYARPGPR
ncbi:tape measure protein [Mycolicibacter algericus]|uniref:Tape measure protein N-terminal domain-containing protein n=2 Tax=Mycolicibacter algericus TaxID=1288388 RepID=A0A7I9Y3Z4_MYCAL|nr:tape measure protein [Mycolicibacter algericus]OQZ96914.1 hypothetical protein BST10_10065 [Mycolicibacter algericus DSM 45454]GFG83392.1 hypothetical protein MALGJ_00680 [Mycolicibacter algericus]